MKYYKIIIASIAICYYCISCNDKNSLSNFSSDFRVIENLKALDSVDLEKLGLLLPFDVSCFDSCFVFSNIRIKNRVTVLDRNSYKSRDVIYAGDGPDEIVQYIPVENNEKRFLFADRVRKKVFELSLDNAYIHTELFQFNDSVPRFFSLAMINTNLFIGTGLFKDKRFLIYNVAEQKCIYKEEYPQNEEISSLSSYQKAALFAGTRIGVHPDGRKFVAAYNGLLDFYRITDNYCVEKTFHKYYHFPLYGISQDGAVIAHRKEEITGFLSLCYDRKYIYLLYSNSSMKEKGSETYAGNIILVFDWEGNPVKRYNVDSNLLSICLESGIIWGVGENHTYLYKYELK